MVGWFLDLRSSINDFIRAILHVSKNSEGTYKFIIYFEHTTENSDYASVFYVLVYSMC